MALQHAIMTALIDDAMSGYELARSFDSSLGFFWRASHQQIYQELKKLAKNGWLSAETVPQKGKPSKIVYTLTDSGSQALADWVMQPGRYLESKDDLMVKLYNLSSENVGHIIAELVQRREQTMSRLYLYERIRRQHYNDYEALSVRRKGVYIALQAGVFQGEQYLQWCDQALTALGGIEAGKR